MRELPENLMDAFDVQFRIVPPGDQRAERCRRDRLALFVERGDLPSDVTRITAADDQFGERFEQRADRDVARQRRTAAGQRLENPLVLLPVSLKLRCANAEWYISAARCTGRGPSNCTSRSRP